MVGLRTRGIDTQTTISCVCINKEEDVDHILVMCPFAKAIRDKIFNWCGLHNYPFNNIGVLLGFAAN